MSLLAAAIVTESEITIRRVPIEFLEIELALLEEMGFRYDRSEEYVAANGHTRLVDLTTQPSTLHAPLDKIHPMPFPGLNIDNLPFFAVIAAVAEGQTLLHDWVYENRAIYLTELNKLGGQVKLLDPHRVMIEGPTRWSGTEIVCPPALRPAVVILLAMLASKGTSVLRSTTSSTAATRTSPSGSTSSAPDRDLPRHLKRATRARSGGSRRASWWSRGRQRPRGLGVRDGGGRSSSRASSAVMPRDVGRDRATTRSDLVNG